MPVALFHIINGDIHSGLWCDSGLKKRLRQGTCHNHAHLLLHIPPAGVFLNQGIDESLMTEIFEKKRRHRGFLMPVFIAELFQAIIQSHISALPVFQGFRAAFQYFFRDRISFYHHPTFLSVVK